MIDYLRLAFIGLVNEDLGHPLDGDGEGDDGVVERARRGRGLLRGSAIAGAAFNHFRKRY